MVIRIAGDFAGFGNKDNKNCSDLTMVGGNFRVSRTTIYVVNNIMYFGDVVFLKVGETRCGHFFTTFKDVVVVPMGVCVSGDFYATAYTYRLLVLGGVRICVVGTKSGGMGVVMGVHYVKGVRVYVGGLLDVDGLVICYYGDTSKNYTKGSLVLYVYVRCGPVVQNNGYLIVNVIVDMLGD